MGGGLSYEQLFNTRTNTEEYGEHIYGFPKRSGAWCVERLKQNVLTEANLRRYFLSDIETSWGGEYTTYGFPMRQGQWCNNLLKVNAINYGVRKPLVAVLHGRTQTSGDTDFRGTSKWDDVNGVQGSRGTQSKESFLQALARRAI